MNHRRRLVMIAALALSTACMKKDAPREVEEETLKGVVRTKFDSPQPTRAQLDRKKRTGVIVKELGVPWLETLPVVEDEAKLVPRTVDEVASRCIATEICAIKGEGGEQELIDRLIKDWAAESFFSPKEKAFVKNPTPDQPDRVNFAWRYECMHVFLWALGYLPTLNPPNQVADVAAEVGLIRNTGREKFFTGAKLRSSSEILDQVDLHYRLLWAAIELRLKGKKDDKINEEILQERLRALNWLIRSMNQAWDDVTTDT